MSKCLVLLADGFESVEAIAPIDILVRAGVDVIIAGVGETTIVSAQNIKVIADCILSADIGLFDLLLIPGGMPGSQNLAASDTVLEVIRQHNDAGKLIGAICAAPAKVLAVNGFLDGRRATCFPAVMSDFDENIEAVEEDVVVDGNIVTSRGFGTAIEFGYKLLELLQGKDIVNNLRVRMLVPSEKE